MTLSEIQIPSNKKFGLFFSSIFAICCLYSVKVAVLAAAICFAGLAITFFILAMTKAELLLPLNCLWMRFGFLLGLIISPLVLGVIFFLLITPISLILRLSGRDELRLKLAVTTSFWKVRKPDDLIHNSFKNQF